MQCYTVEECAYLSWSTSNSKLLSRLVEALEIYKSDINYPLYMPHSTALPSLNPSLSLLSDLLTIDAQLQDYHLQ